MKTHAKCEMKYDEAVAKAMTAEESPWDNYEKLVKSQAEIDKLVSVSISLFTQNEDLRKARWLIDSVIDELKGKCMKLISELQEPKTTLSSMKEMTSHLWEEIIQLTPTLIASGTLMPKKVAALPCLP